MDTLLVERPGPSAETTADLDPIRRLKDGWALVRPHYWQVLGIVLLAGLTHGLIVRLPLVGIFVAVIDVFFCAGLATYLLRAARGERPTADDVLSPLRYRPEDLVFVAVLQVVITTLGLILLLLPGLYAMVTLFLAMPLVAFTRLRPLEALKLSHRIIAGHFGEWAVFLGGLLVANVLGALAMGIGLLVSLPATAGALTLVLADVLRIERKGAEQ